MQVMINGVDITDMIAFQGLKWSRNDVDGPNAGRNIAGTMIRDRVSTKIRMDITCRPLHKAEHDTLMNLLMPEYVTVYYDDPVYGWVTKVMYSNNHASTYCIARENGDELWFEVSFPLIER